MLDRPLFFRSVRCVSCSHRIPLANTRIAWPRAATVLAVAAVVVTILWGWILIDSGVFPKRGEWQRHNFVVQVTFFVVLAAPGAILGALALGQRKVRHAECDRCGHVEDADVV